MIALAIIALILGATIGALAMAGVRCGATEDAYRRGWNEGRDDMTQSTIPAAYEATDKHVPVFPPEMRSPQ